MPAKMRPMFSIDEYASSRFMSVCTDAKMTPNSAVARPAASSTAPHHHCGACSRSNVMRNMP